jgi:transcriptional regulator with XRE-family HTH domain
MKKHIGSTNDSLFEELGELDDVELLTQKKLLVESVREYMALRRISQAALAAAMHTSRTLVHRLLNPTDTSVSFKTLSRVSRALDVPLEALFRPSGPTKPRRRSASARPKAPSSERRERA